MEFSASSAAASLIDPTPSASGRSSLKRYAFRVDSEVAVEMIRTGEVEKLELLGLSGIYPATFGYVSFVKGKKSGSIRRVLGTEGSLWWVGLESFDSWIEIKSELIERLPGLAPIESFSFSHKKPMSRAASLKAQGKDENRVIFLNGLKGFWLEQLDLYLKFKVIKKTKGLQNYIDYMGTLGTDTEFVGLEMELS